MIIIESVIEKFSQKGEKTGWTYIFIPYDVAEKINKGMKKAYRVKGLINDISFNQIALAPMGEGNFILPLNATIRKKIKKNIGEKVILKIEVDNYIKPIDAELLCCLQEDELANSRFNEMPHSHQKYYSNYVSSAKTVQTKATRIANIIYSMIHKMSYAEMLKMNSKKIN